MKHVYCYGFCSLFRNQQFTETATATNTMTVSEEAEVERVSRICAARASTFMHRRFLRWLSEQDFDGEERGGAELADDLALYNVYQRRDVTVEKTDETSDDDLQLPKQMTPSPRKVDSPMEDV